jgi:hypothetical protein
MCKLANVQMEMPYLYFIFKFAHLLIITLEWVADAQLKLSVQQSYIM